MPAMNGYEFVKKVKEIKLSQCIYLNKQKQMQLSQVAVILQAVSNII